MKEYYVYILASQRNGTLYTGMTSNLTRRVSEHKLGALPGFTSKYKVNILVYFEIYNDVMHAIRREKNIQAWKRLWKIRLIEENNPNWDDLYTNVI